MDAIRANFADAFFYITKQLSSMTFVDVIDIVIVSILLYYIFKFIRDRRAGKLAVGVVFMILFLTMSEIFEMHALKFIMSNVFQVGLVALIVVFQPELRSALEKMGGESLRGLKSIGEQKDSQTLSYTIHAICEAMVELSKEKTGALIVIERGTKLGDVIKTGTLMDAQITSFLIRNVFFHNAPLHDGAMIIRKERIYAAGCFLPLSMNNDIIKDLGTRHRAAIGMSENSDAIVLVVSEETGTISMAIDGHLKRNFDYTSLKIELEQLLIDTLSKKNGEKNKGRDVKK